MVSSGPEAKARVSLDSKQFEAAIRGIRNELTKMDAATKKTGKEFGTLGMQAKKVGQEIKTLGTTGRDNLKKIGNSATVMSAQMRNAARGMQTDTTSIAQGTRQIGQAATQMGSQGQAGFNQIGQAATATQPIIRQTAVEMNNARMATLGMVSSVAGLGTGFVTLETTMTNIPKRLNAIAKAESLVETQQVSLQRQNTSLQRLELQLEKMRTEGKKTAEEVAIQERKIIDTRANIELYTGKLADAQEDLNLKHADYADTLKLMATSIFQTFLSAGVTVTMLLTQQASAAGITTSKYVSMKMATLANSKALNFLKIDLATAKANFLGYSSAAAASASASTAAATGIGRVSLGIKGLYAALGPIGWTIIGITAIWQAWEHNLFGFQDAVRETLKWLQKMWETLKWIIPVIGLVDEAFRKFDPEGYNKATAGITEGIDKIGKSSEDAATEIETLGTTMTSTAPAVDQFANLMEDQSQLAVLHAQNMELGAGAVLDFGMAELGSAVAIDRTTGAIRNQTAAMKDATNAMNAYAAAGSKKNDNYPRSTASYEEIIRAHDKNKTSFLSRELDQLRRAIEQRDKDTRFGQLAGQNIVHSSSTYAGFLKTDRGYSRIPLSTFLRSENFGHGGRNIVQGDSISDEYRQLFELAGITLGGSADDAISKFNERSGNNYANPGFQHGGGVSPALGRLYEMTGGRLGQNRGGWTGNRNRKREQTQYRREWRSKAASAWYSVFGEPPPRPTGWWAAKSHLNLSYWRRIYGKAMEYKEQLEEFPVLPDYTEREFRDVVGYRRFRQRTGGGSNTVMRRLAIYGNVARAPTTMEAFRAAFQKSQRLEEIYDRATTRGTDLVALQQETGQTISQIMDYNTSDPHAEVHAMNRLAYQERIILEAQGA